MGGMTLSHYEVHTIVWEETDLKDKYLPIEQYSMVVGEIGGKEVDVYIHCGLGMDVFIDDFKQRDGIHIEGPKYGPYVVRIIGNYTGGYKKIEIWNLKANPTTI